MLSVLSIGLDLDILPKYGQFKNYDLKQVSELMLILIVKFDGTSTSAYALFFPKDALQHLVFSRCTYICNLRLPLLAAFIRNKKDNFRKTGKSDQLDLATRYLQRDNHRNFIYHNDLIISMMIIMYMNDNSNEMFLDRVKTNISYYNNFSYVKMYNVVKNNKMTEISIVGLFGLLSGTRVCGDANTFHYGFFFFLIL